MSETPPQAYISKVHLKGYKSIRDLEIDFKPGLNIIIGPNGSGKTNFLELIIGSLNRTLYRKYINFDSSIEIINQDKNVLLFKISGEKSLSELNEIILKVKEKGSINSITKFESEIEFHPNGTPNILSSKGLRTKEFSHFIDKVQFANPLDSYLSDIFSARFSFKEGKLYSYGYSKLTNELTFVGFTIPNMFNEELLLKKSKKKSYSEVLTISESYISNFKKFTDIKDIKINKDIIREEIDKLIIGASTITNIELLFLINGEYIRWQDLSDGSKRLFYIISSVLDDKLRSILLEEPELGIHPDQLFKLMDFLKEQSKEKQIIITTHSPQVLNILKENELDRIIVTRYDGDNGTKMFKLSEKEQGNVRNYMKHEASISDYWIQTGFEHEKEEVKP